MKHYSNIQILGSANISGSLIATSSYAENAVSASYSVSTGKLIVAPITITGTTSNPFYIQKSIIN